MSKTIITTDVRTDSNIIQLGIQEGIRGQKGDQGDAGITIKPLFHAQDQKPQGTYGGTSVAGDQIRTLNTIVNNEIAGASLSNSQITLPAGEYYIEAKAPVYSAGYTRIYLYNVSTGVKILTGLNNYTSDTGTAVVYGELSEKFTLTETTTLGIKQYCLTGMATNGLGVQSSQGTEKYTDVKVWALNQERAIPLISNTTGNNPGVIKGGDVSNSANILSITPTSCLDTTALIPLAITSGQTLEIPSTINQHFFIFIVKLVADGSITYKAYTTFTGPSSDNTINAYRFISYCKTDGSGVVIPFTQSADRIEWRVSASQIRITSTLTTSYALFSISALLPVDIFSELSILLGDNTTNGAIYQSFDGSAVYVVEAGYPGTLVNINITSSIYLKNQISGASIVKIGAAKLRR